MKFEKGRTKTGGRKKGTPNAVTANVQKGIADIVNGNLDNLREDLKAMTPQERVAAIAKLLPYVVPRKVEADITETMITPEEAAAAFMAMTD